MLFRAVPCRQCRSEVVEQRRQRHPACVIGRVDQPQPQQPGLHLFPGGFDPAERVGPRRFVRLAILDEPFDLALPAFRQTLVGESFEASAGLKMIGHVEVPALRLTRFPRSVFVFLSEDAHRVSPG
ncbi:MAG: hypothetical protein M3552_21490 [Planctomycetota bacterium]|nr:hypothetical protein [Planctomycetota bacterium]